MNLRPFFPAIVFLLLFSCSENKTVKHHSAILKVAEVKPFEVPLDSLVPPIVTEAIETNIVPLGKTETVPVFTNVLPATAPLVNTVGTPLITTPGKDTFLLPEIIADKGILIAAGTPEIIAAKDASTKDLNPWNFSFLKTNNGLKHNSVQCLIQDKSGRLWFGSNGGGLCCYDGKYFTFYTEKEGLCSNYIWCAMEDRYGNLWFGSSSGGASRFDGKSFLNFTEDSGIPDNFIYDIFEDKTGDIWFASYGNGVSKYNGNRVDALERGEHVSREGIKEENGKLVRSFLQFTRYEGLQINLTTAIEQDNNGNIWIGTANGLCMYDGSFKTFKKESGLLSNSILDLHKDKKGNLWIGTRDGGVSVYDGKKFTTYTSEQGLGGDQVMTIEEDNAGNMWLGSSLTGFSKFDGKTFQNFSEKDGLSNNGVTSILADKTGNIWLATYTGGLNRYNGNSFINFTEKEGLINNSVNAVLEDKEGNLWFGTQKGVSRFDGKTITNFNEESGLSNNHIFSILQDKKGNIWFGTYGGGLSRFDGKSFTHFNTKEGFNNSAYGMIEDSKGNLWFGTNNKGAFRYDGKTFTRYGKKQGLGSYLVHSVAEDKNGNFWFATDNGLTYCESKDLDSGKPKFKLFRKSEGIAGNAVYDVLKDKNGILWFATNGGLSRYDGRKIINLTEKHGLANTAVLALMQDHEGNIWYGTRNGISKASPASLKRIADFAEGKTELNVFQEALFYNYGYSDGYLGLSCRRHAIYEDSHHNIWIGGDVLSRFDPKGDKADTSAPVLKMSSIKLFGEDILWENLNTQKQDSSGKVFESKPADTLLANGVVLRNIKMNGLSKWNNLPEELSLPYDNNNISFNFIGIHLQNRNHIKYQYKLEGADPDWSAVTTRTEAPYGNLLPGKYVFKVKAMNQSGIWSAPMEYSFVVRPPWWQTWWFRSLVLISIISGIVFYIKYRERALKKRQHELERTVEERTSEVVREKLIVEEQKMLIEEKQKEIIDSITYAKRIQNALITSELYIGKSLSRLKRK